MRAIPILLMTLSSLSASAVGKDLVVGQTAALADPRSIGNQLRAGIELHFAVVNKAGGVNGNTLKLVSKDRGLENSAAPKVTRELVQQFRPIALIGMLGTGPMEALLKEKVVEEAAIPIVGIRTGAQSLREPTHPWLFHTRAGYAAEAQKVVKHLSEIGYKRIAVFHENSSFGKECLAHITKALQSEKLPLVAKGQVEPRSTDVKQAVAQIAAANPNAIIAVGNSDAVAEFYKAIKGPTGRMPLVALSTVDAEAVIKQIGKESAHGLGLVRVVPDPISRRNALAREFQDVAMKHGGGKFELSQAALEGYISARVLVEALKRSGADPTPPKLKTALEALHLFDLGGLIIDFSQTNHSGSSYVEVGIMGRDGKTLH